MLNAIDDLNNKQIINKKRHAKARRFRYRIQVKNPMLQGQINGVDPMNRLSQYSGSNLYLLGSPIAYGVG